MLKEYHDHDDATNAVVLTNTFSLKHFNLVFSPHKRLGITKDRLIMYTAVFYFHKPSLLKNPFNKELQKYHEAGLIVHWTKTRLDYRRERSNQRTPTKLKVENIFAAFQICALMYLISFIVFILEVISGRYPRIRYILDYLTY